MFSTKLKKMKTIANLSNDFEKRFKLYGEFELFDHVSVIEIFNGPTGWRVALDKGWWPKDTDKKTRRAETDFELGSIITPGGVMINGGYHMRLCIVEEEGLFKVHHYHLFTGN